MADNIVKVKRNLDCIIEMKGLTRIERYDWITEESKCLSEKEIKILIKEYYREYANYDRYKDILYIISVFFSSIGLLVTVGGINDTRLMMSPLITIAIECIGAVMFLYLILTRRNSGLNRVRYILDILEEKE